MPKQYSLVKQYRTVALSQQYSWDKHWVFLGNEADYDCYLNTTDEDKDLWLLSAQYGKGLNHYFSTTVAEARESSHKISQLLYSLYMEYETTPGAAPEMRKASLVPVNQWERTAS